MTATSVVNQICVFFGGPYDSPTHTYRTPQFTVPGMQVGVVRRGKPKRFDKAEMFLGALGVPTGCAMWVDATPGDEVRWCLGGATSGLKKVSYDVSMHVLIYSEASYAEDVQDAIYALRDSIINKIHTDRTFGSGGFENQGFQGGEGGAPWLRWHQSEVETSHEVSKAHLVITYAAEEFIQA